MFENIGKKMKLMAKICFIFMVIASVCGGIVLMTFEDIFILIGLLAIPVGILAGWIGSWPLYGFGEIIDKLTDVEKNTRGASKQMPEDKPVVQEELPEI